MFLENLKKEIEFAAKAFINNDEVFFDMMFNQDKQFGDITTNILMRNKSLDANLFLEKLNKAKYFEDNFSKIELAKNNYINFFLKSEVIFSELERIKDLAEKKIVLETKYTGKNILVEHSSPNLFKPFHVGHLMNNIVGEAVVQMMMATNAKVKTMSFPSDISIGIAKAIYILKNKETKDFNVKIFGEAYVEGVKFYDENPDKQEEIKSVAKNLFEKNLESEDWKIYEKAKDINIKYFLNMLESLGSHFDKLIYESESGVIGEKIVRENLEKVFIESEGAIVFDTKKKKNNNDDNSETIKSVFINSEGHPTYEAKDIGLLKLKKDYFEKENLFCDKSIFVTDAEQVPHFDTVLAAGIEINEIKDICEKSIHVPHGRMTLKGEKMSSRLGNVLTAEEILNILKEKTLEKLSEEKIKDFNEEEKNELIKNISLSALRISILKSKPGVNIDFDTESSLNFEGATGPYLLYTYARANSILNHPIFNKFSQNANDENLKKSTSFHKEVKTLSDNQNILAKKIIEFESVLKNAIESLAPQLIVKYLFELTQSFNTFYAKEKIIDENDIEKTKQNIYLTKVFSKVLKSVMNMIAIKEVGRM